MVKKARKFVLHRNDNFIPKDLKVRVFETSLKKCMNYPEISIIIPTRDGHRGGMLPNLLIQLSEQTYQNFETIIVKGDSRQGRAINFGADIARGKYLVTLDDDTIIKKNEVLDCLAYVLKEDSTIGMAGGLNVIPKNAPFFVRRAMQEIPRRSTPPVNKITDSDLAEHGLLMFRKDVFLKVGGENELIPRGLDPYLRNEFRKAGFRVVIVPQAIYSHLTPSNIFNLIKQFYNNGRQAAFCNKFYPQWVIETPPNHIQNFTVNRTLRYRTKRFIFNMVKSLLKGQWVYLTAYSSYGIGFFWGYLIQKR